MKNILALFVSGLVFIANASPHSTQNNKQLFDILDTMALNTLINTIKQNGTINKFEKLYNQGCAKAGWYYMNAIARSDYSKADEIGRSIFPNLLKYAKANDTIASMMIISFYRFGIGGVKKDFDQAQLWRKKYTDLRKKEIHKKNPDPIVILNNVVSDVANGKNPDLKELEYLKLYGSKYAAYIVMHPVCQGRHYVEAVKK